MATAQQRAWTNDATQQRPPHWKPSKLTTAQRAAIRERLADGETAASLAVEYGVTASCIRHYR